MLFKTLTTFDITPIYTFIVYFVGSWFITLQTYFSFKLVLITFTKNAKTHFSDFNVRLINFFHSGFNWVYFSALLLNWMLNGLFLAIFIWFFIFVKLNWYAFIPFILNFLILGICITWYFLKYWKLIQHNGYVSKAIAIENFQSYITSLPINNSESIIRIYKDSNYHGLSFLNRPFNWHQRKFRKKIQKLNRKNYGTKKLLLIQLNLLIRYLKIYSNFFEMHDYKFNQPDASCFIKIDDLEDVNIDKLKIALINNFFYWKCSNNKTKYQY